MKNLSDTHLRGNSSRSSRFSRATFTVAISMFLLGASLDSPAALKDQLVSYWPLDEVSGTKTPDIVSGYDMELVNLTAADLVSGKVGKAFKFENTRQTMLKRLNSPGEQLPINQHPAFTVSFWANVKGTGLTDLRLFSEANTLNNNPLFNIGTASSGTEDTLDFYFRQAGWTDVSHLRSIGTPLDGTWRHIAFVQAPDGSRSLYIDGALDSVEIPAKATGAWNFNSTSIGGILRANATHWLTGLIDDVALWSRNLSEAEVKQVAQESLTSVFPPLAKGMVSYWPLDEVLGVKTPDVVSGYDMELVNLTAADLVAGKVGKAFKFENTRQTMLKRLNSPGEQLPINQHPALTVSFWANVKGTGLTDLRLFSEANTLNNNPLFNIGTASSGTEDTLDFYFRQAGWTDVSHLRSVETPLDGTWRHIAFVQKADGSRSLYVDGVLDAVEIPAKATGAWNFNSTSIGGILRANATHWLTGMIDDVALWSRDLSEAEVKTVVTTGTPVPFSKPQPLAIRLFKSDLPASAAGGTATLRWDVTKGVKVEIDQGVGDVTAKTVSGLGSVDFKVSTSRTYKLTLTRGTESVSKSVSIAAISDVASGWTLIDNFDRYPAGVLVGNGGWADLDADDFSIVEKDGNKFLAAKQGDGIAVLQLGPLTVPVGQERTLFFRAYLTGDEAEPVRGQVALTDRSVRFGNEAGADIGPGAVISDEAGTGRLVGGYNGWTNPLESFEPALQQLTPYNIWVDIKNGPFTQDTSATPAVNLDTGDTYSIHVQKDGGGARTTIINNYPASRNPIGAADIGFTTPLLTRLIVGAPSGHSTTANLYFDDIYLSQSGYNSSVPRVFGFTTPIPSELPKLNISVVGGTLEIGWSSGTLQSSSSVNGPWEPVAGAKAPSHRPAISEAAQFFRLVP